jgi:hypothetical protein
MNHEVAHAIGTKDTKEEPVLIVFVFFVEAARPFVVSVRGKPRSR